MSWHCTLERTWLRLCTLSGFLSSGAGASLLQIGAYWSRQREQSLPGVLRTRAVRPGIDDDDDDDDGCTPGIDDDETRVRLIMIMMMMTAVWPGIDQLGRS